MSNDIVLYSPQQVIAATYHKPEVVEAAIEDSVYTVIDSATIKSKIMDIMGSVLARCWINPNLMSFLQTDPHSCLLEMGIMLPTDLTVEIHKNRKKDRPRLVIYEKKENGHKHRVCYLQLIMMAGS